MAQPASSEKPTCAALYFLDLANIVHFNRANVIKVRPENREMGFHILGRKYVPSSTVYTVLASACFCQFYQLGRVHTALGMTVLQAIM